MSDHLFVNSSFTPQLRGINLVPPVVKSWSDASDAELAEYLQKHYAGEINLHDYWNIGDTRTVHLSAMPATVVKESHVEQDVEFQLVNAGGKQFSDGRECAFIVQVKDLLTNTRGSSETGMMNSTNTNVGGWKECERRVWCNSVFRAALPEAARNLFKLHKNKTSKGNRSKTLDETKDYFALPCAYNIFGTIGSVGPVAAPNEDTVHWSYYVSGNRAKYPRGSGSNKSWWLRSPYLSNGANFCVVIGGGSLGSLNYAGSTAYHAFAPFGTI